MKRAAWKVVAGLILLAVALEAGDYAWLRLRIARNQDPYDHVQVQTVQVIPHKGNKAEYVPLEPVGETCVRSLFPHMGYQTCWYLRRHTQQQINY
jgi:hypothetical protein